MERTGAPRPGPITRRASLAAFAVAAGAAAGGPLAIEPAAAASEDGEPLAPERFMRPGDRGHGIAFQRMIDFAEARDRLAVALGARLYDISDTPLTVSTALQIHGAGYRESGHEGRPVRAGAGEPMLGTRVRANCLRAPAITFTGGGARGASIGGIAFEQDHPAPGRNWAPIDYQDVIAVRGTRGGMRIGRLVFEGVNRIASFSDCGRVRIADVSGQAFRRGLAFDDCRDIMEIGYLDLWPFWSSDPSVRAYTQRSCEALVLGRVDGLAVGMMFAIWSRSGIRLLGTAAGVPTAIHFDYAYLDGSATPVLVEAPGSELSFDFLRAQCEEADGRPLPGSCLVRLAAGSDGGLVEIGRLSGDYFARNAIRNEGTSAVTVQRPGKFTKFAGSEGLWHGPARTIRFVQREITDASGPPGPEAELIRGLDSRDAILPGPFADDRAAAAGGVAPGSGYRRADGLLAWRLG